ncbi:hypothetical protein RJ639_038611 [Escallonia herrerae]|uniref:Malectin-like domain-containing protein n=1 Tax=Escallonia herrerae TaxID=1293975 RepID=A0AA88WN22_9ASTE|nr:hypothetical protein RJ639_038611 [Escallonia herrerae]
MGGRCGSGTYNWACGGVGNEVVIVEGAIVVGRSRVVETAGDGWPKWEWPRVKGEGTEAEGEKGEGPRLRVEWEEGRGHGWKGSKAEGKNMKKEGERGKGRQRRREATTGAGGEKQGKREVGARVSSVRGGTLADEGRGSPSYDDLRIDCGSLHEINVTSYGSVKWQPDGQFVQSGANKILTSNQSHIQMNTLRFFPNGTRNCYTLPFYLNDNLTTLFRAGFYYGNYDGLSKPPSFRLEIDGNLWANVTTSMREEPIYYELLYKYDGDYATVCLVRTTDGEVPFISSLEGTFTYFNSYQFMDNKTALYLHSRINYGANESVQQRIGINEELFNRVWESREMSEYPSISRDQVPYGSLDSDNMVPWPVMAYAIQAQNITDSIHLSVDFSPRTSVQADFILYFADPICRNKDLPNATRIVEVYIDGIQMGIMDVPKCYSGSRTSYSMSIIRVPVVGLANVTISAAEGSMMPPILNAMEVFSRIDVSKGGGHFLSFSALLDYDSCYAIDQAWKCDKVTSEGS